MWTVIFTLIFSGWVTCQHSDIGPKDYGRARTPVTSKQVPNWRPIIHYGMPAYKSKAKTGKHSQACNTHTHFHRTEYDYDWALLINCYGRFMFSFSLTLPPELALKPHKEALNNSTSPLHKKQSKHTLFKPIFLYGGESSTQKSREPIHHLTAMAGQHSLFISVNV